MMWARVLEILFGGWLAVAPFILRPSISETRFWINDLVCAAVIMALAVMSYWKKLQHAHLAIVGVALWLMGFAYFSSLPPLPALLQNDLLVGLMLLMLALVPNHTNLPPQKWQEFYATEKGRTRSYAE